MNAPDLSVVVVSWNTRQLLEDCLRSLYSSLTTVQAEVWVVDNASSDGSAELVKEQFPEARLIVNPDNRGFAVANNQALRQCAGRYLLLLNSDTVVPSGALDALVAAMDRHGEAAVCGPLLLNGDGTPQINWARFQGLDSELRRDLNPSQSPYPLADYADPEKRQAMEPFPADWVSGACFLVRASAVPAVGLLDEGFFFFGEEADWCRRFAEAGWKTLVVPSVTVTHFGGQSSKAVPRKTRERLWRATLRLYRRMYGPLGAFPASSIATLKYLAYLLGYRRKAAKESR